MAAALSSAAVGVLAQEALPPGQQVVVTATRVEQSAAQTVAHATVIEREQIERAQTADLASLLAREAGLQLSSNGGPGQTGSLFIRGAPSAQLLLLVDGVPFTRQDASGSLGFEHLMLDNIERIEIVRGNVSAVYGSGAVGGVVQVFTRAGGGAPSASAKVEGGSRGSARVAASLRGGSGDTRFALGVSGLRTAGFSAIDTSQVPAANPDRDGYRNASLTLSALHTLAPQHSIGVQVLLSDGQVDYDSAFATPADTQSSRTRIGSLAIWGEHQLARDWRSRITLSHLQDRGRFVESGAFGFSSHYTTTTQMLNWLNTLQLSSTWRATAGLEHQRQNIDTDDGFGGLYDKSRSTNALFAGLTGNSGAHRLQANLRHDQIGGTGSKSSGYLGWGYELRPGFGLRASGSTAFNAPPLGYLHAPFFGNPQLRPENARSAELGLEYAQAAQRLRATLFDSRVRDEFEYDFATNQFGNLARTRNRGLEVSAQGSNGNPFGDLEWRASLTSQDPKDANTGAQRLRRSKTLASLSLVQSLAAWKLGADLRHVGARSDVGGVALAAYSLLDLTAQRELSKSLVAFARIENAGDARYQTAAGYHQAPRGFFAGLRWSGGL